MAGLKEFVEMINKDEELQKKLGAATNPVEVQNVIKEAGFDVTEEELLSLVSAGTNAMEEGELEDDALSEVSGGRIILTPGPSASTITLLQRIIVPAYNGNTTTLRMESGYNTNVITTPYTKKTGRGGNDDGIRFC